MAYLKGSTSKLVTTAGGFRAVRRNAGLWEAATIQGGRDQLCTALPRSSKFYIS
jgi:hypothetical protein